MAGLRLVAALAFVAATVFAAPPALADAREAFQAAKESVVVVIGKGPTGRTVSQGSGVALSRSEIATNWHVVAGATNVQIQQRVDGEPVTREVRVVRATEEPDLAILELTGSPALSPIEFAAEQPEVGQSVYAIGAPRGLSLTLSEGIVSAVRTIRGTEHLQVTTSIASGSSGGPIVDGQGRLVGIASFLVEGEGELNFAITAPHVETALASDHRRKPEAETKYAELPSISGLYAIHEDGALHLLQRLKEHEKWIEVTLQERRGGEQLNSVAWRYYGLNCRNQTVAIFQIDHSSRDSEWQREVMRKATGRIEWKPWGGYKPDSALSVDYKLEAISEKLAQKVCQYASLPNEDAMRFLQEQHRQILRDLPCSYLRRSERFLPTGDEPSDDVPSTLARICKKG